MEKPKAIDGESGVSMMVATSSHRGALLAGLFNSAMSLGETQLVLKKKLRNFFNAEALTIYEVNQQDQQLISKTKAGRSRCEIRLAFDKTSIAGFVAYRGEGVCIKDARDQAELASIDPELKFNSSWDDSTSFQTRQVLAVPVFYKKELFGVIQLFNKKGGAGFTPVDEHNLEYVAAKLGEAMNRDRALERWRPCFDGLIKNGYISSTDMKSAARISHEGRLDLEKVLRREFHLGKRDLGTTVAKYYGVEFEDLATTHFNPSQLIIDKNSQYYQSSHLVPLAIEDNRMHLAINNPHDHAQIFEAQHVHQGVTDIKVYFALKEDIENFVISFQAGGRLRVDPQKKTVGDIISELEDNPDISFVVEDDIESADIYDNSVVQLVNKIIEDSHYHLASDIHIEPNVHNREAQVRYRVDGRCNIMLTIPKGYVRAVVSRIKVLAKMDISEKRKPQDGKFRFRTASNNTVELRVLTMPTAARNEDVVMRLLGGVELMALDKIMRDETRHRFDDIIRKPYGMVLVVGPTGSGKTTTLHSALKTINNSERKIWTVEDPVEIIQPGLRQVQVNPKTGLTFAKAMRGFLRADPDVIMVGEMRDHETVQMGIEASLTGHLVFSTLHTNSAPETISRLIDMRMDPYNFADSLLGILAQRLTRILCTSCRISYLPDRREYDHMKEIYGPYYDERLNIALEDVTLFRAKGCYECRDLGYVGRIGLYELLLNDQHLKNLIVNRATIGDLREAAVKGGMTTLLQDGIHRVFSGVTDMKQVMSVCLR